MIPLKWGEFTLALCMCCFATPEKVRKNEQVITQVEFVPIEELKARREQMETWSQLCLDHLDAFLR